MELHDVTICAADCLYPRLAARALNKSMALCQFGDAVLFSDEPISGAFRHVRIDPLRSRADYSKFILKELAARIETPFVLIIQWDGCVLAPSAWNKEFGRYDHIGAPWPWHTDGLNVGNGGFSLRSHRLLSITAGPDIPPQSALNEDEQICRVYRGALEKRHAIRIAPTEIACRFSYERGIPDEPTFGFHGLFNMWRHESDDSMLIVAESLASSTTQSREYFELILRYAELRKFDVVAELVSYVRRSASPDKIAQIARAHFAGASFADAFVDRCLKLTASKRSTSLPRETSLREVH